MFKLASTLMLVALAMTGCDTPTQTSTAAIKLRASRVVIDIDAPATAIYLGEATAANNFDLQLIGNGRFASGTSYALTVIDGDPIVVPPILNLVADSETTLDIMAANGMKATIQIVGMATSDFSRAEDVAYDWPAALVVADTSYLVLDESQIGGDEGQQMSITDEEGNWQFSKGLCFRTPFRPGKVKWNFSSPSSRGYSIDDEAPPSSLQWASGGTEAVDAVYRSSWGCARALKVPNSCTATFNSNGSYSCCCNAAMAAIGHTCRMINPSSNNADGRYFADCAL